MQTLAERPKVITALGKPVLSTNYGLLYHTDCRYLLSSVRDGSVDCIFADPPFNLGKLYGNGEVNDELAQEEYLKWSYSWIDQSVRKLSVGGALFIYILPRWGYHFAKHLEDEGMIFRHWIVVSMKSTFPRGRRLYPAHYGLLYFTKGKPKTLNKIRVPIPVCRHCGKEIKDYGGHRDKLNPEGLNLTDIWDDTSPARHKKFKTRWHVNELKPMIPRRCIEMSTEPENIVLDPFGGGGSTYLAAQQLKRYWLGSEITDCSPVVRRFKDSVPNEIGKFPPASVLRSVLG
jgi:site-specific DNA-methyltransferase (adenine-specific)